MKDMRIPEQLYLSVVGLISLPKAHTFLTGNQSNGKALNICTPVKGVKEGEKRTMWN